MFIFVGALNFVLDEYAKGAVRTAVDEASQTGGTSGGSVGACEAQAAQVRAELLPGPFGAGVQISCSVDGDEVLASASGSLPSLVPLVPQVHVSIVGFALVEKGPAQ
jgi:hypothetical protein